LLPKVLAKRVLRVPSFKFLAKTIRAFILVHDFKAQFF
jgi:hypothetical protein